MEDIGNVDEEIRLYLVIRSDLCLSREDIATLGARATWRVLLAASHEDPARLAAYDAHAQPKIGLRVKTPGHLERALREASAAGIPAREVEISPGVPGAVGIGPVRRSDLPAFVAKLQLMGDDAVQSDARAGRVSDDETPTFWMVVRSDIDIPRGKLAAQAGHGVWAAVGHTLASDPASLARWNEAGAPVRVLWAPMLADMDEACRASRLAGLPASFIVDAGRTVFSGPTPTVVGIGPCARMDLPDAVLSLDPVIEAVSARP